ncbi:ATP-grasp domain-containing protein [Variovorax humicola]|uniref:ATP-grasp domain-containing protein n=1 Tax=Variovorax humicola TaxID=1769758 RepID=A0ABU8VVA8_9BURK
MTGIMVDGYSSGRFLAKNLIDAGVDLIHVQSNIEVPRPWRDGFNERIYRRNIVFTSENALRVDLANERIEFVLPGSESGVLLAECVGRLFNVRANATATSKLRRNKAEMMRALRRFGIPAVEEIVISRNSDFPDVPSHWFPVVVKPAESAAGDDLRICENLEQAKNGVAHILGKANIFGIDNQEVVLQRKLLGKQYMVNAISKDGVHKIIEIWMEERIHTPEGYSIYDREILVASNFAESSVIQDYVKRVLTALEVGYGPTHTELFFTKDGPILLETAARIQGGIDGKASEFALGYSHLSCVQSLITKPGWFESELSESYAPRANLVLVNLISQQEGIVRRLNLEGTVARLPSFHSSFGVPTEGMKIHKTINLLTKPGHVYLASPDVAQIHADYAAIRGYEKLGQIFELQS